MCVDEFMKALDPFYKPIIMKLCGFPFVGIIELLFCGA